MEMRVAFLIIILRNSLAKLLLPVSLTLCSAGLEVSVPEGGMLPPGDTTGILLKWKLELPPSYSGFLTSLNQ